MVREMRPRSRSLLNPYELKLTFFLMRFVPEYVGTKALTLLGLASAILVFVSYCLARDNRLFLFSASFFVLLQWIFDLLDGNIGRSRKEGFVRWGYYMDHLSDFILMSAVMLGAYTLFPVNAVLFLYFLSSLFMSSFFLLHAVAQGFEVSFGLLSAAEFRVLVILFNTVLFFSFGTMEHVVLENLKWLDFFVSMLLVYQIFTAQRKLSQEDLKG